MSASVDNGPGPSVTGLLAVVDLSVALHKFVNIELHSQGWYAVRVRVLDCQSRESDGTVLAALPHTLLYSHDRGAKLQGKQSWAIEDSARSFRSQIFRIRYCYEEVLLGINVVFRLYLSTTNLNGLQSLPVLLEYELLFQEADLSNPASVPEDFVLKPVAKQLIRVNGVATGVYEYLGCTFDDEHFGLCASGLFSCFIGYTSSDALDGLVPRKSGWLQRLGSDLQRSSSGAGSPRSGGSTAALTAAQLAAGLIRLTSSVGAEGELITQVRAATMQQLHAYIEGPVSQPGQAPRPPHERERTERLSLLYDLLVGSQVRAREALAHFLRGAPTECYAPQSYDIMRTLLASSHAGPGGGGGGGSVHSSPRAAANGALERGHSHFGTAGSSGAGAAGGPTSASGPLAASGAVAASSSALHAQAAVSIPNVMGFLNGLPVGASTAVALQRMEQALRALCTEVRTDWNVLVWVLRNSPRELLCHVKARWEAQQVRLSHNWVAHDQHTSKDALCARAQALRTSLRALPRAVQPCVAQCDVWDHPAEQPVVVLDASGGQGWQQEVAQCFHDGFNPKEETHAVVFVHGFQGASTDLCLVKAHLVLIYPYLECFSSKANEGNTHDSLQEMGKRLAAELVEFLAPFAQSARRPLRRLTFVGHSIGNLILRSALATPALAPYRDLLWLYLSVSGPHLGFLYTSNTVMDTGMALLKSLGKGKCLHQLTFSDAKDLRECYLYRLSSEAPLRLFRHVVLISSPQDRYVPYHSSSVSPCPAADKDAKRGPVYMELLRNLLAETGASKRTHLFRAGVDFYLKAKSFSFSKLVGRTAHIEFIESQVYVGFIMWCVLVKYRLLAPAQTGWV